jgi:SAM-dependent methyltransferase
MRLNKVCNIEDFSDKELLDVLKDVVPHYVNMYKGFPKNYEDRKPWEWAMGIYGMKKLNCFNSESLVLGIASGSEAPIYYLTNKVKFVFATDLYGNTKFSGLESPSRMLTNPEEFAPFPFNQNRLLVKNMDATKITFDDNIFDCVFSFSSIEHFGNKEKIIRAVQEMARVLKPGGILVITTELRITSTPYREETFSKDEIFSMIIEPSGLKLVDEIDFNISDNTLNHVTDHRRAMEDIRNKKGSYSSYPHIILRDHNVLWTSIIIFLKKEN